MFAATKLFRPVVASSLAKTVKFTPSVRGMATAMRWDDPLLIEETLLTEEERLVLANARAYCQGSLFPRVLTANREERFDREIMSEMGSLGLLGATIEGYGCSGVSSVAYGLIAREVERVRRVVCPRFWWKSSDFFNDLGLSIRWTAATALHAACNRRWLCIPSTRLAMTSRRTGCVPQPLLTVRILMLIVTFVCVGRCQFLPRLATGELVGCFGLTEPNHGSDPGR